MSAASDDRSLLESVTRCPECDAEVIELSTVDGGFPILDLRCPVFEITSFLDFEGAKGPEECATPAEWLKGVVRGTVTRSTSAMVPHTYVCVSRRSAPGGGDD